jgi:hypothetical protein
MTGVGTTLLPPRRLPHLGTVRLLRLELRRNVMVWMLPLVAALFWLLTYRSSMATPPLWSVRAMSMQTTTVSAFVPVVAGAAAWMGTREHRFGMTDLLAGTARPRWGRQIATWAATTCWGLAAYLGCVGVLYGVTARQATGGGPLWWPAAVGAASIPALAALGFAAGAVRPSRFTPPLVAVGAFLALELSLQLIHGDRSPWQISPLVAGPWELGPADAGIGTFYRYLPDLALAQLIFLGGLTAALMGALGLPASAGGRAMRRFAAALTAVGLVAAGIAVVLAGTARLDPHGMIAIAALHDTADDRPIAYTPVCSRTAVPVCLNPAYAVYLPAVATALDPVLNEVAGLPGAPARVSQAATTYRQERRNGVEVGMAGPVVGGTPPVHHFILPNQLPGPTQTVSESAATVRTTAGHAILAGVIGDGPGPAQRAVLAALLHTSGLERTAPADPAARRFAALPAAARHAWLAEHLAALRAGRITVAQLP